MMVNFPQWRVQVERGGTITRAFVFGDFAETSGFMARIAVAAEKRIEPPSRIARTAHPPIDKRARNDGAATTE